MQSSAHYRRIARAIAYLQRHHREQPSLADIAAAAHLSPTHFQRIFSTWAGVSPKKFLQYLTVEYAKTRLVSQATLEDAAHDSGLSGTGRLHDLFVSIEGMTPGEFRRGGDSLQIHTSEHETRFGRIFIASTHRGICAINFLDEDNDERPDKALQRHFPHASFKPGTDAYQHAALACLNSAVAGGSEVRLHLHGSPFQLKVWECLLRLPPAHLATYAQIAGSIGQPGAARAVGSAIGSNPVALLIPCHRVIRGSGALGGYRWGISRKAAIIGWEASQESLQ